MTTNSPRTLGSTISSTDLPTFAAYAGMALAIVGSLAPWTTSPLSSDSGIGGDGKYIIILAVCGIIAVWRRSRWGAGILSGIILGVATYDAIHMHQILAKVVYNGVQLDHLGWGVYAVIAGALVTLAALWASR